MKFFSNNLASVSRLEMVSLLAFWPYAPIADASGADVFNN